MIVRPALRYMALAVGVTAAIVLAAGASADSLLIQRVQSDFDPDAQVVHPKEHTLETILAEDLPKGAKVCANYSHTRSKNPNRGHVSVVVSFIRSSGPLPQNVIAQVDFGRTKVRDGEFVDCLDTDTPLLAGDRVVFDFSFKSRPAIREAFGEAFGVAGSVRQVGS